MTEVFEGRPPPPGPYRWGGQSLTVSTNAIEGTLTLLRRFGRREASVFWYGVRQANGDGQIEAVLSPQQRMEPRWYDVPALAMGEMVSSLADPDWKPLAQIHSHSGIWVEHSLYDDEMANSKRALSLVVPNYGYSRKAAFQDWGVHEHQDGYWHMLTATQIDRRLQVAQAKPILLMDFRR